MPAKSTPHTRVKRTPRGLVVTMSIACLLPIAARPSIAQSPARTTKDKTARTSSSSPATVVSPVTAASQGAVTVRGGMPEGFVVDASGVRVLSGYHFKKTSASVGYVKGQRGNTGTISCDCTGGSGGCTVTLKDGRVFCEHGGCSSGCITDISIPTGDGDKPAQPSRLAQAPAAGAVVSLPRGAPKGVLVGGDRVVVQTGYTFERTSDLEGRILDGERDGTGTVSCEPCGGAGSCTLSYKEGSLFCSKSCDKGCGMVITIPSDEENAVPSRARKGG
jgi:hypothetical protein